ncbi:MBL fold metallo-hydrolase [Pelagibius litoralis]|uniref:MBL fold metallo-hydrolase n=1 Tax=Pelagibius litoralis TaxID=374515 RepID=A0A967CAL1_9PROT|nr:MBL fold metallo-hydrolase [Pelagibius litoralis]NIA67753.1 MBL fold metallo-hydrolase [Pelagibius litoralis]
MKLTVLGCGGSGGVPVAGREAGGTWGVAKPDNPKNRRSRVSVLIEGEEGPDGARDRILIDTSPDLRQQILDNGITALDAVLYTHAHADHCHGLDELRGIVYSRRRPIDAYMDARTRAALTTRFDYAFSSSRAADNLYPALLEDHVIDGDFHVGSIPVTPFTQQHGPDSSLGFRCGDIAYSTDASDLDEAAFAVLEGVKLWVVDCLRDDPHPTHSHVAQTLEWIARVKPERAILTHMNERLDYDELRSRCPPGVEPGYDGLVIEV